MAMNRKILKLAIPNIISNISIPLLGLVDMALMGRMESDAYIGATAGKAMRNAMLISTVFVFFPAYIVLNRLIGNHGLWLAFILFMLSRTITMSLMAPRVLYSRMD